MTSSSFAYLLTGFNSVGLPLYTPFHTALGPLFPFGVRQKTEGWLFFHEDDDDDEDDDVEWRIFCLSCFIPSGGNGPKFCLERRKVGEWMSGYLCAFSRKGAGKVAGSCQLAREREG